MLRRCPETLKDMFSGPHCTWQAPFGFLLCPPRLSSLSVKLFFCASFVCYLETLTNSSVSQRSNTRNNEAWLPRDLCFLADYKRWLKLFPITGYHSFKISSHVDFQIFKCVLSQYSLSFLRTLTWSLQLPILWHWRKTKSSLLLVYLFESITKTVVEGHTKYMRSHPSIWSEKSHFLQKSR